MTSTIPTEPSFRDLGVAKKLNEVLHRNGMTSPFPIQVQSLPATLDGRDLCGRAPTGSGKTLAFSIPVVENITEARPHHPTALLLVPTRELASQVAETLKPLAKERRRWVGTFYGGTNIRRDVDALRRGIDIAVCTPGRLEDLVQRGDMHLDEVQVVVLDEADRMADMGFLPVVKRLLDRTPSDRQTLLFSATLDGDVDVLVKRYQNNPVKVEVELPAEEMGQVSHLFWPVERTDRRAVTAEILRRSGPTIVFARTKRGADRLAKQLSTDGLRTAAIHGDRSQNQRERALAEFANGKVTALIATDVAARGIHVDDVSTVVHYDLPGTDKDYVHRSGRTGRAGATGVVVSLVCEDQHGELRTIQKDLEHGNGVHRMDFDDLDGRDVSEPRPRGGAGNQGSNNSAGRSGAKPGGKQGGGKQGGNGGGGNRTRAKGGRPASGRSRSSSGSGSGTGGNGGGSSNRARATSGSRSGNGGQRSGR